jgi:hypothetical protein
VERVREGDVSHLPVGKYLGGNAVVLDGLPQPAPSLLDPAEDEIGQVVEDVFLPELDDSLQRTHGLIVPLELLQHATVTQLSFRDSRVYDGGSSVELLCCLQVLLFTEAR